MLVGAAVFVFFMAIALLGIGAYLIAIPAAKVSRPHAQLVAVARALQAIAAAGAVLKAGRKADEELELEPDES